MLFKAFNLEVREEEFMADVTAKLGGAENG